MQILKSVIPRIPAPKMWSALDIGANIGHWSIFLAGYFGHVVAIEGDIDTFKLLVDTVKPHIPTITPVHLAVMDRECVVQMTSPPKRSASTARFAALTGDLNAPMTRAKQVDELWHVMTSECALMKIDVEGAELRVLHGAQQTLRYHHPIVIVEVIDEQLRRYGDSARDLEQFMKKAGYQQTLEQWPNVVYQPA